MLNKKKKEITKLNVVIKIALKKVYKKYGYKQSLLLIENMKKPTIKEREMLLDYIHELNKKVDR